MATGQMSEILQHLRRVLEDGSGQTDGQLLEGFQQLPVGQVHRVPTKHRCSEVLKNLADRATHHVPPLLAHHLYLTITQGRAV